MISDCGNKINTVKFKIWLRDQNDGFIEVAFHRNHYPHGTRGNDWTQKFDGYHDMLEKIDGLRDKVRLHEATHERRVFCTCCNTVTISRTISPKPYALNICSWCGARGSCLQEV